MVKKISLLVMACVMSLMLVNPIDCKAANMEFYVPYAEPATSDYEGYISVLLRDNATGVPKVETYFWYCAAANSSGANSPCYADITISQSSMTFTIGGFSGSSGAYYCLSNVTAEGRFGICQYSSSQRFTVNFNNWGDTCLAFKYGGNVGKLVNSNVPGDSYPFNIYYNENGIATLLQGILSTLMSTQNIDSTIMSTVQGILSSVDDVEKQLSQVVSYLEVINANLTRVDSKLANLLDKANDILEEQKESNSWLEKIFNLLKDAPEEEKNQASTQGGNSVSEGTNAIEDKGQGFTNSLNGLVGSMSYNGTDCSWTFPTVKLPAIPGVMSETTLIQSQDINFGMWIDAIPSDIMLLIRSVLTMGLIVYCFKEFYDTIAYLLTLRRSDNE